MKTKRCTKCGEVRPYDMFHKRNELKEGRRSHCKNCRKAKRQANKEQISEKKKAFYEANKEKILASSKTYRENNKARIIERNRRRYALKRKAIPKFLRDCEVERKRLVSIYKLREVISLATDIEHHVDHMWPLSDGGPHWSGNLQIITAKENLTKRDKVCKVTKKNIKDSLRIARKEYENSSNGHRNRKPRP